MFTNSRSRQLQRLEFLQKKLGSCIAKSKPYYEALKLTQKVDFIFFFAQIQFFI
jgi:hypothetical protein